MPQQNFQLPRFLISVLAVIALTFSPFVVGQALAAPQKPVPAKPAPVKTAKEQAQETVVAALMAYQAGDRAAMVKVATGILLADLKVISSEALKREAKADLRQRGRITNIQFNYWKQRGDSATIVGLVQYAKGARGYATFGLAKVRSAWKLDTVSTFTELAPKKKQAR